ncbi:hypothetical protein [Carnimonas nigrificans]|uniref:hypothetical protein n=1 Tax=Carnimonas nigrificans TaxID=64323 RepID=UPI000470A485|nr:hypothetical protein [Carnimonas nigrificans]
MKKFVGTIAAGVLLASMAGCSSSPSEDQQPADADQSTMAPANSQGAAAPTQSATPPASSGAYAPAPAQ